MRVRILRHMVSPYGAFDVGQVVDVPDDVARGWCAGGIAMQDKSKEPKETKAIAPNLYWCGQCGCSHKIDSKIGREHTKVPIGVA